MTIIICALIILWLTVVAMIYKIYELDNLFTRYNQRITDNFAQSYDNHLKIKGINRYIDNKAESVLHDEDTVEAIQDRVKQLSNRINSQLELINDNQEALEDKVSDAVTGYYSREQIDNTLIKSMKKVRDMLDKDAKCILENHNDIKALEAKVDIINHPVKGYYSREQLDVVLKSLNDKIKIHKTFKWDKDKNSLTFLPIDKEDK